MPAANVPMEIDQGEDWTCQLVWTDDYDQPQNVTDPCRMDIKSAAGQTYFTLETPVEELPAGAIPTIGLSNDIGLIQLHIPAEVTKTFQPGVYWYDLFVSVDDGDAYAGNQVQRILYGAVTVSKSITKF